MGVDQLKPREYACENCTYTGTDGREAMWHASENGHLTYDVATRKSALIGATMPPLPAQEWEEGEAEFPRKVRLELSWTEQVNRTTVVEVEVTETEMEDIQAGYGSTEPRWVKEVLERHPGAEIMHNEMDHIEVLEPEDEEETKLVHVEWFHTETFERDFRVSKDFDPDEDDEEVLDQIVNLDHDELTEAFVACTTREITEVTNA